jgi:DNA-binding NtrC family response regulator
MPEKICICDDDATWRRLYKIFLESEGYQTTQLQTASEMENFIGELDKKNFHVVLFDGLRDCVPNGEELCQMIHKRSSARVINTSSYGPRIMPSADGHCNKGADPKELTDTIEKVFARYDDIQTRKT